MGRYLNILRLACIGGLVGFSTLLAAAVDFHPVFRILDVPGGLPDQNVEAIIEDVHGYVWIATQGGLVRHEGREMRLLPRDPYHPGALPDNNISALHAHSDGMVWAGVLDAGVVEIGPDLMPRRHLERQSDGGVLPDSAVWTMAEDCDGGLWLGFMQDGLARFDPVTEQLTHYPVAVIGATENDDMAIEIIADSECRLWVAMWRRVIMVELEAEEPTFTTVLESGTSPADLYSSVLQHSQKGMLVSQGRTLLARDPLRPLREEGSWRELAQADGLIFGLAEMPDQSVVISTIQGLHFYDPASASLESVSARPDLPDGLPTNRLNMARLVDREGALWQGIIDQGLFYLPPDHASFARLQRGFSDNPRFELARVTTISKGLQDNVLWLGGPEGIQRLDLGHGDIKHARDLLPAWADVPVVPTFRDLLEQETHLLVLDSRDLVALDKHQHGHEVLLRLSDFSSHDTHFTFLFPADDGSLWVATMSYGLVRYDLGQRQFRHYGPEEPGLRRLPEAAPVRMIHDAQGNLLLLGRSRIYAYTPDQGFEAVAEVGRGQNTDMAFGPDGSLWIAQDAGLSRWQWNGQHAERVADLDVRTLSQNASIRQVFPLAEDEVWLVLSNGVGRLNPQTGELRAITRSDGLPVAEFALNSAVWLQNGQIAIGGSRGLVMVNPERLRAQTSPPPVHLKRLTAGDTEHVLMPGAREPVELSWQQNSVQLEFSALTFVAPERLRYRVRLQGWDDDWIELRERGQMYYSNLRPGRYQFQVLAATEADVWDAVGDTLTIEVAAPPWASGPAFAAYAAVLFALAGAGWRGVDQSRRRRRYLSEVQQKRTLAEEQRQLIERLNADLEPIPLAHAINAELRSLLDDCSISFGYVHEQMPRRLITTEGVQPPSREQWRRSIQAASGQSTLVVEFRADDETIAQALIAAPEGGFQSDHPQRLALLVDLAEQALHNSLLLQRVKRLAERAEAASHAKSEFLATMSHEIRTPLHGVMGMAELLHEKETESERLEMISTLRASGQQLQRVIDDVLDISGIEAGRLNVRDEPFELISLLEHVVDLHAANAARKGLDLRLLVQSDLPACARSDPDRLVQILGNLLNNAVKFTPQGGVELSAGIDAAGQIVLAVSDSGPGIDPADRDKLFQPFSQLDASIRRLHGGSGLGLAICRRLAKGMGAELSLVPQRWPGSRFVLRLSHPAHPGARPLSHLLQDLELVALLPPATYRVAWRLSRRWGFELRNGWQSSIQAGALLLLDRHCIGPGGPLQDWLSTGAGGWCLESPYPRFQDASLPVPDGFRVLRWPLLEARLIAALVDWKLESH